MNEFDRDSSDELPPELVEIENLLRNTPQPDLPEGLLDNLLSQLRTHKSHQDGAALPTVRAATEQATASRSFAEQQPSARNARFRRPFIVAATLIVTLGGVVCLWPIFKTETPDRADVVDLPPDNTVVAHFSQETDPCFILPQ